jgi:hypothetical protein
MSVGLIDSSARAPHPTPCARTTEVPRANAFDSARTYTARVREGNPTKIAFDAFARRAQREAWK